MKLTAQEQAILSRAALNTSGFVGLERGHRGRRIYGSRASNAARKLRDAGLLVYVSSHTDSGYRESHTSTVWQITEKGRAIANA